MQSEGGLSMSVYDTMVAGLSGAGLVLLGAVTTHGSSEYHLNAAQLEAQLQASAEAAIAAADLDWLTVRMDGQKAILSGNPPTPEAVLMAERIVLESAGKGGPIYGGVISVERAFIVRPAGAAFVPQLPQSDMTVQTRYADNRTGKFAGQEWSE